MMHAWPTLNAEQQQAALSPEAQILLLAGAGSGKTRTLVARFLHWQAQGAAAWQFFILTFTNKAAREMRTRLYEYLPENFPWSTLWLGTFHGLAYRLLRQQHQAAGLAADFPLLDAYEQRQLLKKILKEENLQQEEAFSLGNVLQALHTHKEAPAVRFDLDQDPRWWKVLSRYQQQCQSLGALDFSDLLAKSQELLALGVLGDWPERFAYVLVDEFQDTNPLQYRLLQTIAKKQIFVVGDDDQSIYGFRGAKPLLLKTFLQDFPKAKLYRLEENYRSTPEIVRLANHVIAHSQTRLGKTLYSQQNHGDKPKFLAFRHSEEESKGVIQLLQHWQQQGIAFGEMAVLYRQHRLCQSLETTLLHYGLPYHLAHDTAFYQRSLVQAALAYLRLFLFKDHNLSFQRIINEPPRGLGEKSQEKIFHYAATQGLSAWDAGAALLKVGDLRKNIASGLESFYQIFKDLDFNFQTFPQLLQRSGLLGATREDQATLQRLLEVYQRFWEDHRQEEPILDNKSRLQAFLAHSALFSNENTFGQGITLASIHGVKGLEFRAVVILGLEEGQLPHHRSLTENSAEALIQSSIEEERRLFYVAITRAKSHLALTFCEQRQSFNQKISAPSRFLEGLNDCLQWPTRFQTAVTEPAINAIRPGRWVEHPQFGFGEVLENRPPNQILVAFSDKARWLRVEFVKLR